MDSEQRRERARLAQRRSRAQRRRDLEGLKTRVEALESSLEQLIESCLGFSDSVISALKEDDTTTLRNSIKPFVHNVLSISRSTLDGDTPGDGGEAGRSSGHTSPVTPATRSQSEGQSGRLQLSPRMTYGLLPSTTQANQIPLDIVQYLSPQRYKGFTKALFWNTLLFAKTTLDQPTSPLWESLFFYPLQMYSLTRVRDQITRRARFKPSDVKVVVPTIGSGVDDHPRTAALLLEDVEFEAKKLHQDHELIVQHMYTVQDDISAYLEAAGVEQYLAARWGLSIEPTSTPEEKRANVTTSRSCGWNIPNAERIISYLASRSKCLGDRIGFPIIAVDEAVSGLLNVTFR